MKHLLSIKDLSRREILKIVKKAAYIKKYPKRFSTALYEKVLLTFFELPSLRTELSFDTAMFQMGGEVIDYHAETSPWAKGKESIEDVARVVSRYCDVVMMRMKEDGDVVNFAKNSRIPVINGLTNFEHPCQILGDLLTILEKKKTLKVKVAYLGDANNNVTHSLMYASKIVGFKMSVACPRLREFCPQPKVAKFCRNVKIGSEVEDAVRDADVVYTDSWMSYRIAKSQHGRRAKILRPFQVSKKVMGFGKKGAIFMHCLPALRGEEVTKDVIDGKQSVVFDQAENRLHVEKAVLLKLLGKY